MVVIAGPLGGVGFIVILVKTDGRGLSRIRPAIGSALGAKLQQPRVEEITSLLAALGQEAESTARLDIDRHGTKPGPRGDPRGVGARRRLRESKGGDLAAGDPAQI